MLARLTYSIYLIGILVACALPLHAQNLILNGDFEAGPHDIVAIITDWTSTGAAYVASAMEGSTSGSFSAALNIGGDSEGTVLSQTFATVSGQTYLVEFDSGIFGISTEAPLKLNVRVLGAGTLLDSTITPVEAGTSNPGNVAFHHYRFVFIADASTATLQFTDIGLGNANADIVIDSVSVAPTTLPLPTALPLANGDFETGPFNMNGSVAGWLVTGAGQVSILPEGATTGTNSAAFSSGDDSQDNVLWQRFFTTAGQKYSVDFDSAVFGMSDFMQQLRVRVLGNNALLDELIAPPYFASFDPSSIALEHYHFVFIADSTVSSLEFTGLGRANAVADVVLDTVSVAPVPNTFAEWQAAHFTPDQLNDPAISGWDADPDHDGIPNGLEYFFNTDPLAGITTSDSAALPRIAIETFDSSPYVTCTFRRLIGWMGNAAIVGVSDDLITWDETESHIELVSVTPSGDGITEFVKARLTPSIGQGPVKRKFLRVSLTQ